MCAACPRREHAPQTAAGWVVWRVLVACRNQVRTMGLAVVGLDAGAILAYAAALRADLELVAAVLPAVEVIVAKAANRGESE